MHVVQRIAEIQLAEDLSDPRPDAVAGLLVVPQAVVQPGAIAVVSGRGDQVEAGAQAAAPFQRSVEVGVAEGRIPGELEAVQGPVEIGVQRIVLVELVGQGGVDVAEVGRAAGILAVLREQLEEPVGIGRARAQDEGGPVGHDRALELEAAGQQADAHRAGDLLGVAFAGADVEDGGDAPAELGGDAALVELHFADDVGVAGGEDAEQRRRRRESC